MDTENTPKRGFRAVVAAIFRVVKLLVFLVLLIVSAFFVWNLFNDDDQKIQVITRTYDDAPAPIVLTPASQLNINESTAAPNLPDVVRYDRLQRSIVLVKTGDGLGSGVLVDNQQCLVVTNEHVVSSRGDLVVYVITRFRANGEHVTRKVAAEIVGRPSEDDDLAVLKLAECANLPYAPLGNSEQLRAGDNVIAVGHPEGLGWSVTNGIVSHPARFWGDYSDGSGFPLVQTSAAINPGNSGGGLFTPTGYLVGINSMRDPSAQNLGFARSSVLVAAYLGRLQVDGRITQRTLGVVVAERDGFYGLTVKEVATDSVAARLGLQEGDIVLTVNGVPLDGAFSLKRALYADADGMIELAIARGEELYTAEVAYSAS